MKTWLHRISHHAEVSYPLLERGYLSIGFSDFVDEAFVKGVADGGRDYLDRAFEERWGFRARTRHNLWNFIVEMHLGDRIVVPSAGVFSVYRITDEHALRISEIDTSGLQTWGGHEVVHVPQGYLRDTVTQNDIDLGFARKVEPIETGIPRSGYADAALASRMKIRSTTANISDLGTSVDEAIASFGERRPINLHSKILAQSVRSTLDLIKTQLTPDKLESLIRWYFLKVGASEVFIPAKNEAAKTGDADVIAAFEPIKTIIYVQAKAHAGETSDWAAKQIHEYKKQKATSDDGYARVAWVVSTCDAFSLECQEIAKETGVLLVNGEDLATLLLEAGIGGLDKAIS